MTAHHLWAGCPQSPGSTERSPRYSLMVLFLHSMLYTPPHSVLKGLLPSQCSMEYSAVSPQTLKFLCSFHTYIHTYIIPVSINIHIHTHTNILHNEREKPQNISTAWLKTVSTQPGSPVASYKKRFIPHLSMLVEKQQRDVCAPLQVVFFHTAFQHAQSSLVACQENPITHTDQENHHHSS